MYQTYRILTFDHSFYPKDLQNALATGKYKKDNNEGVYLVSLRVLKKDKNILVYNYIYYPDIFVNYILGYLIIREDFKNNPVFQE